MQVEALIREGFAEPTFETMVIVVDKGEVSIQRLQSDSPTLTEGTFLERKRYSSDFFLCWQDCLGIELY